jgi:protoporphyrinogen oxidase
MTTAVIGAGASGLTVALMLDDPAVVLEQASTPGGHCGTIVRDGFTFDEGPHIMFSRNEKVLQFMIDSLGGNVHTSKRNNRVCIDGSFVKYPIENDLAGLPEDARNQCLLDFLFNDHSAVDEVPANLDDWFLTTFGKGLTDLYFRPYNEKIWNVPLRELSMTWADRIPQPPAIDVVKGALGISTEGYLHQLYYHYPLTGGYQALTDAWADALEPGTLRVNTRVEALRPTDDGVDVVTSGGVVERFDRVICTAPLPTLLSMVPSVPDQVRKAVDALVFNPMVAVTLGFEGADPHQFTAVYFPDPDFLVNRISAPCVFSPHNGPSGCYSIQAEITFAAHDYPPALSDDELVRHVHEGLQRYGIVPADHPLVLSHVQRLDYAYVVYTVAYEKTMAIVHEWAEQLRIFPHGRFGAFEYLNVDGCVERSLELASRLNKRTMDLSDVTLRKAGG